MINLLMGPPGAGKSYEAVVYHVLPALLEGRKVITNLPLQVEAFKAYGIDSSLIEIRQPSIENPKPFSSPEDYGSEWRGENGIGPLYAIDECHKPLPKGMTLRLVEEWYAEHRHEGADVLLMTQSYGKISQSIRDMVQVVYRVRKATALGTDKRYIRKVQDGLRGEVMNENIRTYNPRKFHLYKSHTKSNSAVAEATAKDVRPFWKHWSVIGGAIMVPVGVVMLMFTAGGVLYPEAEPVQQVTQGKPVTPSAGSGYVPHNLRGKQSAAIPPAASSSPVDKPEKKVVNHPFAGYGLHISAYLHSEVQEKTLYSISVSQNGQKVFSMSDSELVQAGYEVRYITPCLVEVSFKEYSDYVTCDAPKQSVAL